MTSSGGIVWAVIGFVPPLGRANFILSPSLKRRSISLYLAASEADEDEGLVKWTIVTSKPMQLYGVFTGPSPVSGPGELTDQMVGVLAGMELCCGGFTLDLSTCIDHADKGEDALEYFDHFISNAIA